MKWRKDKSLVTRFSVIVMGAMILASMVMSVAAQETLLTMKQCRSQMRVVDEKIKTLSVLDEIPSARASLEKSYTDECASVLMQKKHDAELIENCNHLGDTLDDEIDQLTTLQELLQHELSSWKITIDFLNKTKGCGRF